MACAIAVAGCQFPKDPEGTLGRATGGVLRVGVVENEPFVKLDAEEGVGGVEAELIEGFAKSIGARIDWTPGNESDLIEALKGTQLDVVIGGFERKSLWRREISLTRPYLQAMLVLAVPPGFDPGPGEIDDIEQFEGQEVAVIRDGPEAALLEQRTDVKPRELDSHESVDGPAVAWDYELEKLGLESTGEVMHDAEHAMAVPPGENAFQVALERYLLDREGVAERLVKEQS